MYGLNEIESVTMYTTVRLAVMSIQIYFKPNDGLPNPEGPLLQSIPSQAIASQNSQLRRNDRENCGAPTHKLALHQLWPSIYFDKCGSLEYSRAFQTSMMSCFTFIVGLHLASTCTIAV